MKIKSLIIALICCFVIAGCFIADDLINEFRGFKERFELGNKKLLIETGSNAAALHNQQSLNSKIICESDTLYRLNITSYRFIDSLKHTLLKYDSVGSNVAVSKEVMMHTFLGSVMQKKLSNVYLYSRKILISESNKHTQDTIMVDLKGVDRDTSWLNKYFNGSPTMAALVTLSKFQNVCLNTELQCQKVLQSKINKK
jgi:hypothetical protein